MTISMWMDAQFFLPLSAKLQTAYLTLIGHA